MFGKRKEKRAPAPKRPAGPPVFSFERTLKRPDLSPRAAEYGFAKAAA